MIDIKGLRYSYKKLDEEGNAVANCTALDSVDIHVNRGDFVAILGANGSGKSTLAKHINAILYPDEGAVILDGIDVTDETNVWCVRETAGMVFQNPDNQIVASVVEEDVAFGPENLGVPTPEIIKKVDSALDSVGMEEYRNSSPNKLSGGQKQRVAIAGVLAMETECIIFDEPTAMLDPAGRESVIAIAHELNKEKKKTVILITHFMNEVTEADHIFVMDHGRIVMEGSVDEIFSRPAELKKYRLELPTVTELSYRLNEKGAGFSKMAMNVPEFVRLVEENEEAGRAIAKSSRVLRSKKEPVINGEPLITLHGVTYDYETDAKTFGSALKDVNLTIYRGEYLCIIGRTGSGKSTLIQHLNGLLTPTVGEVCWKGENINKKGFSLKRLRGSVGMVFQYPEHQLFGETVIKDVCFGPENLGKTREDAVRMAVEALRAAGVDESFFDASPFELSGGQKRRVAIAGVLAMKPEVMVLDEPMAGLDPAGRDEILSLISDLREKQGITIVMVSHSMEDAARFADRLIVMDHGRAALTGTPGEIFGSGQIRDYALLPPEVTRVLQGLYAAGFSVDTTITGTDEAVEEIFDKCFVR